MISEEMMQKLSDTDEWAESLSVEVPGSKEEQKAMQGQIVYLHDRKNALDKERQDLVSQINSPFRKTLDGLRNLEVKMKQAFGAYIPAKGKKEDKS